jgi:hypothetical protein
LRFLTVGESPRTGRPNNGAAPGACWGDHRSRSSGGGYAVQKCARFIPSSCKQGSTGNEAEARESQAQKEVIPRQANTVHEGDLQQDEAAAERVSTHGASIFSL